MFEEVPRGCITFAGQFIPLVPASHDVVVGSETIRIFFGYACDLGLSHLALQPPECSRDGLRDVVANCEYVAHFPVIAFGPNVTSGACINQLRRHAHVMIGALYAALDDVANIEILSYLPDVRGLVLYVEGGIASHDNKVGKLGQPRDQLFGNPIGKVLLVVSGTHVVKGQNSDGRVLGERKSAFIAEKGVP